MQNKNEKELVNEIGILISDLGNYDTQTDEYKSKLNTIGKEVQILETMSKISSSENKLKYDREHFAIDYDIKKQQLELEKDKKQDDREYKIAMLSFEKEKEKFDRDYKDAELELKKKEIELKEKYEKRTFIVSIVSCAVPAVIGLISNLAAMKYYNKLAVRALNMEYIDNSITPRSYNECMNNINKFVSKK